MFKIKDGYKLELKIPETMKLFESTKKLIDKTKESYYTFLHSMNLIVICLMLNQVI